MNLPDNPTPEQLKAVFALTIESIYLDGVDEILDGPWREGGALVGKFRDGNKIFDVKIKKGTMVYVPAPEADPTAFEGEGDRAGRKTGPTTTPPAPGFSEPEPPKKKRSTEPLERVLRERAQPEISKWLTTIKKHLDERDGSLDGFGAELTSIELNGGEFRRLMAQARALAYLFGWDTAERGFESADFAERQRQIRAFPEGFEFEKASFAEAIAHFRSKTNLPSQTWRDIWQQEHDTAFVVAGVTQADLLNDVRAAVDLAVADGLDREGFQEFFFDIVSRFGWTFESENQTLWRSDTIYQTNMRVAFAAGRKAQMDAVIDVRPYRQWLHGDSRHPRPLHQWLDGRVFPADSVFWEHMSPPAGWGCQCEVVSLSKRDVEREGLIVEEPPEIDSTINVDGSTLKIGADEGWDYSPGDTPQDQREQILQSATARLPEDLQKRVRGDVEEYQEDFQTSDDVIRQEIQAQGQNPTDEKVRIIRSNLDEKPTRAALVWAVLSHASQD